MREVNLKYLVLSLALVLFLTLSSGCTLLPELQPSAPSSPPVPSTPPAGSTVPINPVWTPAPAESGTFPLPSIADVVAKVKPSVAAIDVEVTTYDIFNRPFTQQGAGSGWVIDENGIIVTNNHVVEGANTVTVTLSTGENYSGELIHTDSLSDLAVIKVNAQGLPALNIGDSAQLRVGDWVIAIGNSLGEGISATSGIVSRKDVSIDVGSGQTLYDLIQTDAAINPGNSGGPLVNLAGEVIGITSAKLSAIGVEGMGYAIDIDAALPIIEALISKGYVVRPWLGVVLQTVNQVTVMFNRLAVDQGVLITQVALGSPADQAGLLRGDVIVSVDGTEITTAQGLIREIHARKRGQTVEIVYWRGESEGTTLVTLIESPQP
ncbi:S1C family serine protease [Chloroflexota bacterium]